MKHTHAEKNKKIKPHHRMTAKRGRIASRRRKRATRRITEPVVPMGLPIVLILHLAYTGRMKNDLLAIR